MAVSLYISSLKETAEVSASEILRTPSQVVFCATVAILTPLCRSRMRAEDAQFIASVVSRGGIIRLVCLLIEIQYGRP